MTGEIDDSACQGVCRYSWKCDGVNCYLDAIGDPEPDDEDEGGEA